MKHRDLLIALADLAPIRVQGRFERHLSLKWDELMPSAAGVAGAHHALSRSCI